MTADRILPQDIPPRQHARPERPGGGLGWVVLLLVVAVLIGAGVWLGGKLQGPEEQLPAADVKGGPTAEVAPAEPVADSPPVTVNEAPLISPGQLLLDRERAEAALTGYLATKRELEQLEVLEWGGEDYAAMLAEVKGADAAFSAEQFAVAADGYESAKGLGEQLVVRADDAFADLLAGGQAALAAVDGAEAERLFGAALAIRPEDEDARNGLRRSATIERTADLMKTGEGHEANRLYELALTDFEEAARLDPLHEEARAATTRVQVVLEEQTFREAMSDALGALSEGRLPEARARILQARALRPEAPEVKDALFQITEAERAARIEAMGKEARALEAAEDWAAAHETYRAVLAIDANVTFAREGAARCASLIRIQKKMAYFQEQPALLQAPDGRATARLLLTEWTEMELSAPKLTAQAEAFERMVLAAETPVPVLLVSDGQTRVDVYQVGRFEPFRSHPLELVPGRYTVVGHRRGFRDVRLTLDVNAGDERVELLVKCTDEI